MVVINPQISCNPRHSLWFKEATLFLTFYLCYRCLCKEEDVLLCDVGSCYNPFNNKDNIKPLALDIAPANPVSFYIFNPGLVCTRWIVQIRQKSSKTL